MKREELIMAVSELNHVFGLKPPIDMGLDEERVKTLLLEGYAFKRKHEKMTPETESVIAFITNECKLGDLERKQG